MRAQLSLAAKILRLAVSQPAYASALIRRNPGRDDRVPPPLVYKLVLSYACNLRCAGCFQWGASGWCREESREAMARELDWALVERLFADAATSTSMSELDVPVENLKNLGPSSAAWLKEIGVRTQADLRSYGPVLAYRLLKQRNSGASLNMLWAMAAARSGRDWRELGEVEKQQLLARLEEE